VKVMGSERTSATGESDGMDAFHKGQIRENET
jgi:hypothetical protein